MGHNRNILESLLRTTFHKHEIPQPAPLRSAPNRMVKDNVTDAGNTTYVYQTHCVFRNEASCAEVENEIRLVRCNLQNVSTRA